MGKIDYIINNISEKFINSIGWKGKTFEILENPSRDEIESILDDYDTLRFIADSRKKNVLIFSSELLHFQAVRKFNIDIDVDNFTGVAYYENGKIVSDIEDVIGGKYMGVNYFDTSDLQKFISEKIIEGDYDYLKRYHFDINHLKNDSSKYVY